MGETSLIPGGTSILSVYWSCPALVTSILPLVSWNFGGAGVCEILSIEISSIAKDEISVIRFL
ncbi:hypothetical protein ACFP3I_11450 [Chryseobacterium arachidis]|uniref:hypothetical protein n=1 Tax=Chryseobacterium arachidis TaxID=1416778 RepID=UPI00361268AC